MFDPSTKSSTIALATLANDNEIPLDVEPLRLERVSMSVQEMVKSATEEEGSIQVAYKALDRAVSDLRLSCYDGRLDFSQAQVDDGSLIALLEQAVAKGVAEQTKTLDLFYNNIETVPASMSRWFPKLEHLLVGCNPLHLVQTGALPSNLKTLDLGYSETLSDLPDELFYGVQHLEVFWAGCNRLQRLPRSLMDSKRGPAISLQRLELYGNSLKELPEAIGSLESLRILNIGRNQLRTLPRALEGCRNLQILHVYENDLEAPWPAEFPLAFPKLSEMVWRGNPRLVRVPRIVERRGIPYVLKYFAATGRA